MKLFKIIRRVLHGAWRIIYIPSHNSPPNDEAKFYREVFDRFYPKCEKVIPYYWMPKWSDGVSDPSARCLENYDC